MISLCKASRRIRVSLIALLETLKPLQVPEASWINQQANGNLKDRGLISEQPQPQGLKVSRRG